MLILSQLLDGHSFRREFGRVGCFNHVLCFNEVPLEVLVELKVPDTVAQIRAVTVSQAHEQHSGFIKANHELKSQA